ENNIISTGNENDFIYIFKKSEENDFYLWEKKVIQKHNNNKTLKIINEMENKKEQNKILVDKHNKQIIIYYSISTCSRFYYDNIYYLGINIYDNDLNLKKILNYDENGERFIKYSLMKILNKEYYIVFNEKIILISAKYLEIVNIYEINFK
uniref:hypothetical protein n=1 Tax=uncultured Methanobrevibacter sp. TaxID=253161 RepID=UPI00262CDAD8